MENTAYNRHIADQIKAINQRYIKEAERRGQIIDDMPITRNSVRGLQGAGFWDDFASGFTKGFAMPFQAVTKLVGGEKMGGIQTGGGFWDDFASGFTKGFAMPFQAVTKLVGGEKKPRGRPRKMAGIQTGGGFLDDVLGGVQSAVKLAPLLGLGKGRKMAGISTGGIGTGGISTGGRRKMTKKGGGFLDDVLNIATKVAPLALALGKPQRGRKAKKMGGEIALNLREEHFSTPSAIGNMPIAAGRRRRMGGIGTGGISTGGIGTGGISTGGLSRKLLGARAVGSGYAELEGAGYMGNGFFDDVLEGIGNVGKLVTTGVDVADKLGLLKKGKGRKMKRGGIGTGGISTGGISTGGKRGASKWVQYVKAYAKKHNISYKDALKQAKASYRA